VPRSGPEGTLPLRLRGGSFPEDYLIRLERRLLKRTRKTRTCWLYEGRLTSFGRGRLKIRGKYYFVHRIAYELWVRPIPDRLGVLHTCDVRNCIRPSHLWTGTHQENVHDAVEKSRIPGSSHPGELNGQARLTRKSVLEIRRRYRPHVITLQKLSDEFEVSKQLISRIVRRECWRHLNAD
jgi:hypothetical protein